MRNVLLVLNRFGRIACDLLIRTLKKKKTDFLKKKTTTKTPYPAKTEGETKD